jgi:farnesyl diphosphate synthase
MQVQAYINACLSRIDTQLDIYLPDETQMPESLHKAMRYATLNGGKRVRPLLVYATGRALDMPEEKLDPAAVAVEFIHAYSLVHDDLPAMDDDETRRGVPTCHIAFDEATAILAGDALQTLAMEVIADAAFIEPEQRTQMIACLAKAAGSYGMVGGQAIDIAAQAQDVDVAQLAHLHRCKTGALIRASIQLAALVEPIDQDTFNQLTLFAESLGLAFQIRDDILDVESDQKTNKASYPNIMGLAEAKQWLTQLHQEALGILAHIDGDTEYLKHIADFIVVREQ